MNKMPRSVTFCQQREGGRKTGDGWLGGDLYNFNLFIHSFIYSLPIFSAYNSLIFMLMDTWGGGWVLMTYLQWRSLDGLACPSKNSCEIRRNNRRVVVVVAGKGGRRGGFAAAEALHSNGRVCLE